VAALVCGLDDLEDEDRIMIPFKELKGLHADLEAELLATVQRVVPSTESGLAGEVEAFENAFAAYHGVPYATAVTSGSHAVTLALRTVGINPGDEVLTTAFVSESTLAGIANAGAQPVFVDVEASTATLCPAATAAAVTPRTKVILPVHLCGHPADVTSLVEVARRRRLVVIEDCSEAAGARCQGRPVGTLGDLGVFGFEEGNAIITRNAELSAWLWRLRRGPGADHPHVYDQEPHIISPLAATQALLLSIRLARMEVHTLIRRRLADLYDQLLGGVVTPLEQDWARHVYTGYAIRAVDPDALEATLKAAGIATQRLEPAHWDRGYGVGSLPVTERLTAETLLLPMHIGLKEEDVRQIVRTIHASLSPAPAAKRAA
jgi:dTDP-4-amino-4,6-dideoxygalactose transaminase